MMLTQLSIGLREKVNKEWTAHKIERFSINGKRNNKSSRE